MSSERQKEIAIFYCMTFGLAVRNECTTMLRKLYSALFVAALLALVSPSVPIASAADPPLDTIRVTLNADVLLNLPLWIAADDSLFTAQHLNVVITLAGGASALIIPALARGDIDMTTLTANPSFFNQVQQGFDAKIFASASEEHKGWNSTLWFVERQDAWDAKVIRSPADLRGKRADGGPPGGTLDYFARLVLIAGGLTPADLTFGQKFRGPADWFASLRNNINDVQALYEPTVTELESQGVGHRWISMADVEPGFQEDYLAASGAFLKTHRDAVNRFLVAYIKACKLIDDAHGKWTPDMVRSLSKWSKLSPDVISRIPTPPYVGEFGTLDLPRILQMEHFWHGVGLVNTEVPVAEVVDTDFVATAQRTAGVRR
jgi:NitT/TauT family transport system substrate-binding protein